MSGPPTCGSVSEKRETALCAATETHNCTFLKAAQMSLFTRASLRTCDTITPQHGRTWEQVRPWIKCWLGSSVFVCDVIVFVVAEDTRDGRETQKRNSGWEAEQVIVYEA